MKEAIGGSWLFNIVIFFVILFTGYMCMSINHTKAFNVKDEIVKIIEREGGFDSLADANTGDDKIILDKIANSLKEYSYRSTNTCPSADGGHDWVGFDREGNRNDTNSAFCIREINTAAGSDLPKTVYYQVVVFYQLDLPIFNQLFKFNVKGDTRLLYE